MTTATDQPVIDILDRAFWQRNPHDAWTWCRVNDPVHLDERSGIWCITKHADVLWVERNDDIFSSDSTYRLHESPGESNMIASDDPVHLHQRRLVNRRFTPRAVKAHSQMLDEMIDKLVDPLTPLGRTEVIGDLAGQLPARFTAWLLGFDEDEWWPSMKVWSERLMRIDARDDSEVLMPLMTTLQELMGAVVAESDQLRGCPAHGLLSTWSNATLLDGSPMPVETIFQRDRPVRVGLGRRPRGLRSRTACGRSVITPISGSCCTSTRNICAPRPMRSSGGSHL